MADLVLEVATDAHIPLVAATMREDDRLEVLASGGLSPVEALTHSLHMSEFARTAFVNGEALCMFGVVPLDEAGELVVPWMLTTTLVEKHPLTFWRASKMVLGELRKTYPDMVQYMDARCTRAVGWARRLGFAVDDPQPFGLAGLPFHRISIGVS